MCTVAVLLLSACATGPKVDWQSRVGEYTFDQAVLELGPPDKDAKLTDGMRVSEWLTYRSRTGTYLTYGRGGLVQTVDTPTPEYYLRLTFDTNGKLQSFKKYAK